MREGLLALFTGSIYGGVHTVTGHPLDTVKSRMQLDPQMGKLGTLETMMALWREEGIRSFFRGCIPPLWGSMVYRGIMLSGYELTFTWAEKEFAADSFMRKEINPIFPVRPIVLTSSVVAAFARGVFEAPIEYAKVMGQLRQPWKLKDMYRGVSWQLMRTTALISPVFASMDWARRNTQLMSTLQGNFIVSTLSCGFAYAACWPLETMKNLAQSGIPKPFATIGERLGHIGGFWGIYRGFWPGCTAGAIRNGCGMVAMVKAQQWATKIGLRD